MPRMDWLFGKRLTPEEMLRKNKRALDKAIRDLDRERFSFKLSNVVNFGETFNIIIKFLKDENGAAGEKNYC